MFPFPECSTVFQKGSLRCEGAGWEHRWGSGWSRMSLILLFVLCVSAWQEENEEEEKVEEEKGVGTCSHLLLLV